MMPKMSIRNLLLFFTFIGTIFSCTPKNPPITALETNTLQVITVEPSTKTPAFEPSNTPLPIPTIQPTPQPFLKGLLVVGNYEEIYTYNLETKKITLLDENSGFIHDDINVIGDNIYYLRTMPNDIPGTAGFGPGQVYKLKVSGGDFIRLSYTNDYEMGLTASPDGTYLAYWSDNNNFDEPDRYKLQIYDVNSAKISTKIQNNDNQYGYLSWSPDVKKLVFFEINLDNIDSKLYLYELETEAITEISSNWIIPATRLAWSPDGESLVMAVSNRQGYDINLLNLDTGLSQKISAIAEIPDNFQWSPDGSNILFEIAIYSENEENSPNGLFMINLASGNISTIQKADMNHGLYSYNAQWSSNGSLVEYSILDTSDRWKINLLNIETQELFEIKLPEPYNRYSSSWKIIDNGNE